MTDSIIAFLASIVALFGVGVPVEDSAGVGGPLGVFSSKQVGVNPQNGYVLTTDGANSSWQVATGGGASLSGGSSSTIAVWTSPTTIGPSSSPAVGFITATRTDATSTLPWLDITQRLRIASDYFTDLTGYGLKASGTTLAVDDTIFAEVTDLHSPVTLSGVRDYITLVGQDIVRGVVDISDDTNLAGDSEVVLTGDALSLASGVTRDSEISTESALETFLSDVTNVYTNNDGTLADDDLTNNQIDDLSDVGALTETTGDVLSWNGSAWVDVATSTLGFLTQAAIDTIAELEALTGVNILTSVEADTESELETLLTDVTNVFTNNDTIGTANISGLDISDDTNLTAGDALTLTGDDIDFDGGTAPGGELGGTWASPTLDDSLAVTSWNLTTPTLTSFFGTPCTGNEFLQDISDTGAFTCVAATGGGGGGGMSTTTDNNAETGETISYITTDFYVGGSASNTAELNFDKDTSKLTISAAGSSGFIGIATTSSSTVGTSGLVVQGNGFFTGNATATNVTATGTLRVASLTGLLKATSGVVSAATAGTDYLTTAITSFNGLTNATQLLATTSANTGWGFTSSGSTHTLNIPTASANVPLGLLSSTDWSTFNSKQAQLTAGNMISIASNIISATGLATTSIDASSELSGIVGDETGAGSLVFSDSPTFTGTATYANLTGTNATSTYANTANLNVSSQLSFGGATGTTWASFCTSITGSADLCDGSDASGGGGGGGASDFTFTTFLDANAAATGTRIWAQAGIAASSTSYLQDLLTSGISTSSTFVATSTTATSSLPRLIVSTAITIGTEYITNFTNSVRGALSAGTGLLYSAGQFAIDLAANFAWTGSHDFGAATVEIPNSTSLPGTCSTGQIYADTDATSGQRLYLCQSANTWVLQGDGGSGGASQTLGTSTWASIAEGWVYPGSPSCNAMTEIADGRQIHTLKAEFLTITDGVAMLRPQAVDGCNGYAATTTALIASSSQEQYITVSGDTTDFSTLMASSGLQAAFIATTTALATSTGYTGIELDIEGYASWPATSTTAFYYFLNGLGAALHKEGKKLSVDVPPVWKSSTITSGAGDEWDTANSENYYQLKYSELAKTSVDRIVIMAYDYHFDYGGGSSMQPLRWISDIVAYAEKTIKDKDRIVIGIPAAGYWDTTGGFAPTQVTKEEILAFTGSTTATRDTSSGEMKWTNGGNSYVYCDSTCLDTKRDHIESLGIKRVSVWHVGGNDWFTEPDAGGKFELGNLSNPVFLKVIGNYLSGANVYQTPIYDFVNYGTQRQEGWASVDCPAIGFTNAALSADGVYTPCPAFNFLEDTTAVTAAGAALTDGGMYSTIGGVTAANDGAGIFIGSAAWVKPATNTPIIDATLAINAAATSTNYYIGFGNLNPGGSTYETQPTVGCFLVASSSFANWQFETRTAAGANYTRTDTGVASSSIVNAETGVYRRFVVKHLGNNGCVALMGTGWNTGVLWQPVAYHTTHIATTTALNFGIYTMRNTASAAAAAGAARIRITDLFATWRRYPFAL